MGNLQDTHHAVVRDKKKNIINILTRRNNIVKGQNILQGLVNSGTFQDDKQKQTAFQQHSDIEFYLQLFNLIYFFCRYWYDRDTAVHVDQRIQRGLFLFACTNSCMNPIVYGVFNIRARRTGGQVRPALIGLNSAQNCRVPSQTTETPLPPLEISLKSLQ